MGVRATDDDAQRDATGIGEHRTLGSKLTAIGGILARIFPHPEATWSSLRPHFANSIEWISTGRTPEAKPSKACGRRQLSSIPESSDGSCYPSRTLEVRRSTDNRFARHRKCPPQSFVNQHVDDLPSSASGTEEAKLPCESKVPPGESKPVPLRMHSTSHQPPC